MCVHVIDREDFVQEGHIYDYPVEEDRVEDSSNKPEVHEGSHCQQTIIL